jgi:hypothetical protein
MGFCVQASRHVAYNSISSSASQAGPAACLTFRLAYGFGQAGGSSIPSSPGLAVLVRTYNHHFLLLGTHALQGLWCQAKMASWLSLP